MQHADVQTERRFGDALCAQTVEVALDAIRRQVCECIGLRIEERARAPDDVAVLLVRALADGFPLALEPVREPCGRRLLPQGVVDAPRFALCLAAGLFVQRGQHTPPRLFDEVPRLVGADAGRLPVNGARAGFLDADDQIYPAGLGDDAYKVFGLQGATPSSKVIWWPPLKL